MLIKYTVITTKSLVLVKPTIAKYDGSLKSFLASKNVNVEDVIEVLCGESFSPLTSVDLGCLDEINIDDLKEKGKTIHINYPYYPYGSLV